MKPEVATPFALEPERYELSANPAYQFEASRRDFFKLLGAGLLVMGAIQNAGARQESGVGRRPSENSLPQEISAWLHIGESGTITVFTGKAEMGQNIRTSLSQAVSEELKVSINVISVVMGDTKLCPFDMGTFGSRTTPIMNLQLRKVASAARDTLVSMAADDWKTDASKLKVANGTITDPDTGRSVQYASLVKGQQIAEKIPVQDPLIPPADWKVAGQPAPKIVGRDFVTGKHCYPSDQRVKGMLYGKVIRPDRFNATLVSADAQEAEKIPGITVVHDGNFLAIAAPTSATAAQAAKLIKAEWKADAQPSDKELFE